MSLVGFDPNAAVQQDGAITGLRIFYSGFPIVGTVIAMLVMNKYDVTEKRANEIRKALDERAAPPKASGSSYYQKDKILT